MVVIVEHHECRRGKSVSPCAKGPHDRLAVVRGVDEQKLHGRVTGSRSAGIRLVPQLDTSTRASPGQVEVGLALRAYAWVIRDDLPVAGLKRQRDRGPSSSSAELHDGRTTARSWASSIGRAAEARLKRSSELRARWCARNQNQPTRTGRTRIDSTTRAVPRTDASASIRPLKGDATLLPAARSRCPARPIARACAGERPPQRRPGPGATLLGGA